MSTLEPDVLAALEARVSSEAARREGLDLTGSEWERWFGDPWRAAESIAEVVDFYESLIDEMRGRGEATAAGFAAQVTSPGPCPWGLCSTISLSSFLESPAGSWESEFDTAPEEVGE